VTNKIYKTAKTIMPSMSVLKLVKLILSRSRISSHQLTKNLINIILR